MKKKQKIHPDDLKIISEFSKRKERCIATDAEYTDKELVEILSNTLKRDYKEDIDWLIKTLADIRAKYEGEVNT